MTDWQVGDRGFYVLPITRRGAAELYVEVEVRRVTDKRLVCQPVHQASGHRNLKPAALVRTVPTGARIG